MMAVERYALYNVPRIEMTWSSACGSILLAICMQAICQSKNW